MVPVELCDVYADDGNEHSEPSELHERTTKQKELRVTTTGNFFLEPFRNPVAMWRHPEQNQSEWRTTFQF